MADPQDLFRRAWLRSMWSRDRLDIWRRRDFGSLPGVKAASVGLRVAAALIALRRV